MEQMCFINNKEEEKSAVYLQQYARLYPGYAKC